MAEYVCDLRELDEETWDTDIREPVVRCRDCESAREHYESMDVHWCNFMAMYVSSSDFCCWGKRRDDG